MSPTDPCPECGAERTAGLCPRCLIRVGLDGPALSLSDAGELGATIDFSGPPSVLETLAAAVGAVPRVLLRDTEPAAEPPLNRPSSPEMPAPSERPARLRLLGEIARGGMGAVLKGRDDDLGRDLAVKVLLEKHRANPDFVRRFVEEAQIGGQLQHPGIVPIYELGTFADRRPYFAMKLVKGRTLAELLAERPTPADGLPKLLGTFESICQTVAYAHARGVIHRDLKPSNVMVGGFGEVQVMDWGLAKVLPRGGAVEDAAAGKEPDGETVIATARSGDPDAGHSHAGSVMGTPAYMAPEQARGEVEAIDERADVFALGSILCKVLTGAPAFGGRTSGEIQRKAARGETAEALARLDESGVDPELIALARDCLAAEPADRPRDARVVSDRVTAHLVGVQERLRASERERAVAEARAVEERRKRRWQLGLAASVAAFLLLGVAGLGSFAAVVQAKNRQLAEANAVSEKQRLRAESNEAEAIAAVGRFGDAVANEPALQDNPSLEGLRKALLKAPLAFFRSLRERLQADGDTRPEALARLAAASFELGWLTSEIGNKQDALIAFQESLAIRRKLAAENPTVTEFQADLAVSLNNIGILLRATGEPAGALAAHEAALAIRRKLAAENPAVTEFQADLAISQVSIGILLSATGKPAEALAAFEAALAIQRKLAAENPAVTEFQADLAGSHNNIGIILRDTGEPAGALAAYEAALSIRRKLAAENPAVPNHQRDLAISQNNIGILLRDTGEPAGALAAYEAALAIQRKLAAENPAVTEFQADLARSHHNIGILLRATGEPAGALAAHEAALAIRRKLAAENPAVTQFQTDLALSQNNIGILLRATGEPAGALAAYEAALAIRRKLAAENPTVTQFQADLALSHNNIGILLRATGEPAGALAAHEAALAIRRKLAAENPTVTGFQADLALSHINIGNLLRDTGEPAGALAAYEAALAIQRKLAREHPESPDYASTLGGILNNIAMLDLDAGRFAAARDRLREAVAWQERALAANPTHPTYRQFLGNHFINLIKAARGLDDAEGLADAERGLAELRDSDPAMVALDARLAAVLAGEQRPEDAAERLALAQRAYDTKRYAAAARLWTEALEADPALAESRQTQHPYNAACAAALAAAGQGVDDPPPRRRREGRPPPPGPRMAGGRALGLGAGRRGRRGGCQGVCRRDARSLEDRRRLGGRPRGIGPR